jgi:membrane protein
VVWHTLRAFVADNVTRLGAALAFYTTVAVAPLLVFTVTLAAMVFEDDARVRVLGEIERLAGAPVGSALEEIENPRSSPAGQTARWLGGATLLFGAIGVFYHLQDALNSIWRVHPPENQPFWRLVARRLFSLATVLATGFLLLVSLVLSATLTWLSTRVLQEIGGPAVMLQVVNLLFSLAMVAFLFAMIFKLLPDTHIPWRHVWLGAIVTALLFTLGKTILAFYLSRTALTTLFGAAGSVLALLLWCYYAAQIVFLGAEFTRVAAKSNGGRDFRFLEDPFQRIRTL